MNGSGEDMDVSEMTHAESSSGAVEPRLVVRRSEGDDVAEVERETVFDIHDVSVYYGTFRAVRDLTLPIARNEITALIGPSGCGKTTFLRCLNRMNDLIEGARVEGQILYHGVDLYDERVDPVEVRRRIGMVFQKPNPVPEVDLRQRRIRPADRGLQGGHGRLGRGVAPARRAVGRSERQAEGIRRWRSPAGSSNGCASRGRSRRSPT